MTVITDKSKWPYIASELGNK